MLQYTIESVEHLNPMVFTQNWEDHAYQLRKAFQEKDLDTVLALLRATSAAHELDDGTFVRHLPFVKPTVEIGTVVNGKKHGVSHTKLTNEGTLLYKTLYNNGKVEAIVEENASVFTVMDGDGRLMKIKGVTMIQHHNTTIIMDDDCITSYENGNTRCYRNGEVLVTTANFDIKQLDAISIPELGINIDVQQAIRKGIRLHYTARDIRFDHVMHLFNFWTRPSRPQYQDLDGNVIKVDTEKSWLANGFQTKQQKWCGLA